ncbi:uncharacterized protein CLUP02_13259 [Colletotrichum lupini]|uniref:Uncharacterized protein n=1 Tax=Colletotrichum lupini TaxID=145971 RepID=A0A9Q8WM60_9PEZI|nr:uncharacterized protein CLUP02_13259 [Colletotrichum lupini]UQC87740.1 hypothetical protein CLUP02_13259 [Colletotrichum lupini]
MSTLVAGGNLAPHPNGQGTLCKSTNFVTINDVTRILLDFFKMNKYHLVAVGCKGGPPLEFIVYTSIYSSNRTFDSETSSPNPKGPVPKRDIQRRIRYTDIGVLATKSNQPP